MADTLEGLLVRELGNLVFGDREREAEQRKLLVQTAEKSLKEGIGLSPETYQAVSDAYGPDLAGIYKNIEASPQFKAQRAQNEMAGAVAQQVSQPVVAPFQGAQAAGVPPELVPRIAASAAQNMTPANPIAAASNFGLDYGPAPGAGLPRVAPGTVGRTMRATPFPAAVAAGDAPAVGQPFAVSEFSPEASGMFSTAEQTAERPPTVDEYAQRVAALPAELRGFVLNDAQVSAGLTERGQKLTERGLGLEEQRIRQGDEGLAIERRRADQADTGLNLEQQRVDLSRDQFNFEKAHTLFTQRQQVIEERNRTYRDALDHVGSLFGVGTTPPEQKRLARYFARGGSLPPQLAKKIGLTPAMLTSKGKGVTGAITPKMLYERMNTVFNAPVALADSFLKSKERATFNKGDLDNRNDIFLRDYVQSTMEFLAGTGQPLDMQRIEDHIFKNGRFLVEGGKSGMRAATLREYIAQNPDARPLIQQRIREFSTLLAQQNGAQLSVGGQPEDRVDAFLSKYKPGGQGTGTSAAQANTRTVGRSF